MWCGPSFEMLVIFPPVFLFAYNKAAQKFTGPVRRKEYSQIFTYPPVKI